MPNSWYLKCNASGKKGGGVACLILSLPLWRYIQRRVFPLTEFAFFSSSMKFSSNSFLLQSRQRAVDRFQHGRFVPDKNPRYMNTSALQTSYDCDSECTQQSTGPFCSTHPTTTLISKACFKLNLLAIAFCTVLLCMYRGSSVCTATR